MAMDGQQGAIAPGGRRARLRELVLHLTMHELVSAHRFTVLGWAWPLIRQLAQLVVIVFLFSKIVDLGVGNYAIFVFAGLISWTWFATAVDTATTSLIANRHLVLQPRFPPAVLPVVAVAVAFVDCLIALPVLVVMTIVSGDLAWTIVFLPVLFAVQFALTCGVALVTSVVTVYLRDVRGIVAVGLTLLFYLTPVFYDVGRVPDRYEWVLRLNPLTTLIQAYRAILLGSSFPPIGAALGVVAASALLAAAGALVFTRLSGGVVDEL
jgi:ABC-type polysaccharide/polyol phosphate export permease